jgi:cytoskeletal protein RodZ
MTARHNIRIGNRRLGRDRAAIDATPAPPVGEMLQNARERKGVDLFRAERDTKIRLKYLTALEDSDYSALPPLVYTKGFLRNYAIYLGLDPEDILARWRDETQVSRRQERPAVTPPPQPLVAPRRGIALTPGLLVAGLFSLVVIAVFAWIGWQLVRFADVPNLSLTNPPSLVSTVDADSTVLSGSSGPRSEITVTTPDGRRMTVIADDQGDWSLQVELAKGRNDFTVIATDGVTHRQSDPLNLIINVPLPGVTPSASAAPSQAPVRLSLSWPPDALTVTNGQISVRGTTTGARVTIESTYVGPIDGSATPLPGPSGTPPVGQPTASPPPDGSPAPSATPEATTPPLYDLTIDSSGAFDQTIDLPAGRWLITVTASATGVAPVSQTRSITVKPATVSGISLVITASSGDCWLRIIVDGTVMKPKTWGGPVLTKGNSVTVTGTSEIYIRTGNASALSVTQNGQSVTLSGTVGNWLFHPGLPPEQTSQSR